MEGFLVFTTGVFVVYWVFLLVQIFKIITY